MRFMLLGLILAIAPSAQAVDFTIVLDVAQATTAGAGASGSGSGTASLDPNTNILSWNFSYSGLSSPELISHFHREVPGVSGPVVFQTTNLSPKIDSTDLDTQAGVDPNDILALLAGNWYANIHTQLHFGGEIRGQLVPVFTGVPVLPRVVWVLLAGLLVAGAFWSLRRGRVAHAHPADSAAS